MPGYSRLDKLLHRLALEVTPIAEFAFDLDQRMAGGDPGEIVDRRHAFVSGLARAGTTVLMRRLHGSGRFRSLTYRDMPFVLAPNFWRRLTANARKDTSLGERAHGDRILVGIDSPESLDEVFWRVFDGESYIAKDHLRPHDPAPETVSRYVRYVNAILRAQGDGATRYLCKNNNNVLRLPAIRRAFPNALILIPVRDPLTHAESLLRQHRNFLKRQAEDPFVLSYMTWLVHHEFGRDHRPFRFDRAGIPGRVHTDTDSITYWLDVWRATHAWIEQTAPGDAVFVGYEDMCRDPAVWRRIAEMADLPPDTGDGETFEASATAASTPDDPRLVEETRAIYHRLVARGRAALG